MSLNQLVKDDTLIKIIDPCKKEMIYIFNSYAEASKKLLIPQKSIRAAACTKTRRYSPILKKDIVVRLISKNRAGAI